MASLNKIKANMAEMFIGKPEHFGPIVDRGLKETEKGKMAWGAIKDMTVDRALAKDYKGEGMKRAGALALRHGVPASMWMGGSMAIRAIDGGSFTTNSNGERDIAGIPFI